MKIDIPFLSSTWALGSSDTDWTSSEQSIIKNVASVVVCTGMCPLHPGVWSQLLVNKSDSVPLSSQPEWNPRLPDWSFTIQPCHNNTIIKRSYVFPLPSFHSTCFRSTALLIVLRRFWTRPPFFLKRCDAFILKAESPASCHGSAAVRMRPAAHLRWSVQSVTQIQMCFTVFCTLWCNII